MRGALGRRREQGGSRRTVQREQERGNPVAGDAAEARLKRLKRLGAVTAVADDPVVRMADDSRNDSRGFRCAIDAQQHVKVPPGP